MAITNNLWGSNFDPGYDTPTGQQWGQDQWNMFSNPQFNNDDGSYNWQGALDYFGGPTTPTEFQDGRGGFQKIGWKNGGFIPGLGLTDISSLAPLSSHYDNTMRNEELKNTPRDQMYDGNLFAQYLAQRDPNAYKAYMESRYKPELGDKLFMGAAGLATSLFAPPGLGSIFRMATGQSGLSDYANLLFDVYKELPSFNEANMNYINDVNPSTDITGYDMGNIFNDTSWMPNTSIGSTGLDYSSLPTSFGSATEGITQNTSLIDDIRKNLNSPLGQTITKFIGTVNPKLGQALGIINGGDKIFNGNIAKGIGEVAGGLGSIYSNSQANKQAKRQAQAVNNSLNQMENIYSPNGAYAQQMRQQLERRDAAAGRRSQYGNREVELAAALANSQANALNNSARIRSSNDLSSIYNTVNKTRTAPWQDIIGLLNTKGGQDAVNWGVDKLSELF